MPDLRTSLIRLAAVRADLRPHLLRILAGEHLPATPEDWQLPKTERGMVAGRVFFRVLRVALGAFDDMTREKANAWRAGHQRYRLEHDIDVIRAVNVVVDAVQKQMDLYPDVVGETSTDVLLDAVADHIALRFNLDSVARRSFREALWVF